MGLIARALHYPKKICFLEAIKDDPRILGPRIKCQHGVRLHLNIVRLALGLHPPLTQEELKSYEVKWETKAEGAT